MHALRARKWSIYSTSGADPGGGGGGGAGGGGGGRGGGGQGGGGGGAGGPCLLVSPASLLDSQHGCIASPHAKKESGQTPLAVWSCTVSKCGRTVSKDE